VRAGVKAFADMSRPGDELFTIVFNENVRLGLPETVPFTQSRDMLEASLVRFPSGGQTALHDAVIEGLAHLEMAANQKRILVVLSDGDDNASRQKESNMLYRAGRSSALIYTISTADLTSRQGDPGLLRKLAQRNGGLSYAPHNERELVETFETVARNMRRGYTIGYAPTNTAADGTYRRIRLAVTTPGRRVTVRARDGYTAPDDGRP
jgi:VWFA-related protein